MNPAARGFVQDVRSTVEASLRQLKFEGLSSLFYERVEKFVAAVTLWGRRINLTARPDDASALAFHIVDSLLPLILAASANGGILGRAFATGNRILDLGSGAGFPGLILAAASNADFVLLESRRKRASFLALTAGEMGLRNVRVDSMRRGIGDLTAEFDTVTARAFADTSTAVRTAGAALKGGGIAIFYIAPRQRSVRQREHEAWLVEESCLSAEICRGAERVPRSLSIWRKVESIDGGK